MADYKIVGFNAGQITLAFDGKQVNFPVPMVNGVYTSGANLDTLLASYVAQNRAASAQAEVGSNHVDLAALVEKPTAAQLGAAYKVQRDVLLRATDWTQLPNTSLTPSAVSNWATYRQGLRDLTKQAGFPTAFAWPIPPSVITNPMGVALTKADGSPTQAPRIVW